MYAKIDIKTVKVLDPVYVRHGRGTSHVFASGNVSAVYQDAHRVKVLVRKVLWQCHKAEKLDRNCSVNANEVFMRPNNAELNIKAPFSLVGSDFECILTAKGIVCTQIGNRLKFEDKRTVCAWTSGAGLAISQGGENVFLNGQNKHILFVLNEADIVEWYNMDQLEN